MVVGDVEQRGGGSVQVSVVSSWKLEVHHPDGGSGCRIEGGGIEGVQRVRGAEGEMLLQGHRRRRRRRSGGGR